VIEDGCPEKKTRGVSIPNNFRRMKSTRPTNPDSTASISDYTEYKRASVTIEARSYVIVSKQGVFSHGRTDPASLMLARRMSAIAPGDTVLDLNCGNGMVGTVAALHGAGAVHLLDRNVLNADAAARTIAENGATNAEVHLAHGTSSLSADLRADVVAIRIPRERLALQQLVVDAFRRLRMGGSCYVAGATNEGIKTAAGIIERIFGSERTLDRDSGHRLLVATKRAESPGGADDLASPYLDPEVFHEFDALLRDRTVRVFTRPGVFSWNHLDEATAILSGVMDVRPGENVLDIGCGAGALGTLAGLLSGDARVLMLDADVEAVRSARRTADAAGLQNAEVRTSDVGAAVQGERFDVVVSNPPFHVGKATDLEVPMQFIADAHAALRDGGRMYLVANRTLPYERAVQSRFGNVEKIHDGVRFKVLHAVRQ
jgi:16S rRNA (guanine1207-N2)-methyltransferase